MAESTRTVRIKRLHERGKETDLESTTSAERLSMMWQLTLDAWSFKGEALAGSRLPRHVVRLRKKALSICWLARLRSRYTDTRATGDIDLWVDCSRDNASRVMAALARFGAPLHEIETRDFETPGIVFQIGIAPRRVDILTTIDAVEFEEAWPERKEVEVEGLKIPVISRHHLLQNKRATGRPRDQADAIWLIEEE
jgi:hypothetical protein